MLLISLHLQSRALLSCLLMSREKVSKLEKDCASSTAWENNDSREEIRRNNSSRVLDLGLDILTFSPVAGPNEATPASQLKAIQNEPEEGLSDDEEITSVPELDEATFVEHRY